MGIICGFFGFYELGEGNNGGWIIIAIGALMAWGFFYED